MLRRVLRNKWESLLRKTEGKKRHVYLFPSYWHSVLVKPCETCSQQNYFTACPNRGAGIGHQMSNWHAGYWWAHFFGLRFAHTPFAQKSWERFLGYGVGEPTVPELKKQGYKVVRIPMFDEFNEDDMMLTRQIIESYRGQKIVFYAEQDQHYHDQIGVISHIREKFYSSVVRESDLTPFDKNNFNIAVHVRRGDITIGQINGDPNLTMRWLDNDYFERVLEQAVSGIKTEKEIHIYIFSQGTKENFASFEKFPNVHLFLDLNPESTFLSFVYADLLITSKSSFSYKPALLNVCGKKICPADFWHSYPDDSDWILAGNDGLIPEDQIKKLMI